MVNRCFGFILRKVLTFQVLSLYRKRCSKVHHQFGNPGKGQTVRLKNRTGICRWIAGFIVVWVSERQFHIIFATPTCRNGESPDCFSRFYPPPRQASSRISCELKEFASFIRGSQSRRRSAFAYFMQMKNVPGANRSGKCFRGVHFNCSASIAFFQNFGLSRVSGLYRSILSSTFEKPTFLKKSLN